MKSMTVLFCLLGVLSWQVQAKSSHIPEAALFEKAQVVVVFGEQRTSFQLAAENGKKMFYFTSSDRAPEKRELSAKDYNFLAKRISNLLKKDSNDLQYCQRKNMILTVVKENKTLTKSACVGSKTPIAVDLAKLANSLTLVM
jgi:hypothetical protein